MIWFLVCVIFVLLFITLRRIHKVRDRSKYLKNISGPKPFLFFGNLLDFVKGSTAILEVLTKYLDKYGDKVLVHDGAFTCGIVNVNYNLTEFILNSSTFIDKADHYKYLHNWLGQGLLTSTGSKWRLHRKAITPSFHFSILQGYIDVFDNVGDVLVKKLQQEAGKDNVEISKTISHYALDVISEATMGVKVNSLEQESQYIKNIKIMCNAFIDRLLTPLNPAFYPLTWNCYKEKGALKFIHNYVDDVINKRIENHKQKENTINEREEKSEDLGIKDRLAFLDLLLKLTINGKPLSRKQIRDEVNTFMFEGHDTTSSAITFCLLMIATHPEVQDKVLKEQREIFGKHLKTARPTYQQLNNMKYLDFVIKETLRLYPSVPYIARKLTKDLEFEGTLYPKGITIQLFLYAMQRNPEYFHEPEKFIPERFGEQMTKAPYSYIPFSAGPRNCIGQKFAMLEMLSTVSKIVRNFELGPAKPEHRIQLATEAILISKNGVRVSIQNRI